MCRMAIYGNITEFKPLARALDQLEKSMGGDGNGFYNPTIETYERGLSLTTGEIAFDTYNVDSPTMYHTRYATAGGSKSELNHPFPIIDGALMHNGHWAYWTDYKRDEKSDTQTAATLVSKYGPGILLDEDFDGSGVWVVSQNDELLVIPRGWRDFLFQWTEGGGYIHASELIEGMDIIATAPIEQGKVYRIKANGDVVEVELDKVEMPDEEFMPNFAPKAKGTTIKKKLSKKEKRELAKKEQNRRIAAAIKKNRKAGTKEKPMKLPMTMEQYREKYGYGAEDTVGLSPGDGSWERWNWLAEEEALDKIEMEEKALWRIEEEDEDERAWRIVQDYEEKVLEQLDNKMSYDEDFFSSIPTTDFDK